jgi:SAM-dependent methyltransferase
MKTTWSKEKLVEFLCAEDLPYQKIQLPYGLSTKGKSREETSRKIFAEDLSGKTILDVGCSLGYFCFEALKRGAQRAIGVDVNPDRVRQARLLADCLGVPAEFYVMDIEKELPNEVFDIVISLNVLHHFKEPIHVLARLISITREKLILEIAGTKSPRAARFLREMGVPWWQLRSLTELPLIVVGRGSTSGTYPEQKFFISRAAIRSLLLNHRKHFARVDIIESEFKNRYLAIAHRRRIDRLIVVAGPTDSGKSTFIRRLQKGGMPLIASQLGLEDASSWKFTSALQLHALREAHIDRLILHYDFLRPWNRSAQTHERDEALDLLESANEITFVTLWAKPETLLRRIQPEIVLEERAYGAIWKKPKLMIQRIIHDLVSEPLYKNIMRSMDILSGKYRSKLYSADASLERHRRVERLYKNPSNLLRHYKKWLEFCESYNPKAHWIMDTTEDPPKPYLVSEWADRLQD